MKNTSVPVAQLSAEELAEVRAYKREIARRFRERRKLGLAVERDRLGIGGHKTLEELTPDQAEARHAYFAKAQRRWRSEPENRAKANERTWQWHQENKAEQAAYRKAYRRETMTPERDAKYHRKHLYGLTEEEYDVLLMTQCGKCAICGRVMDTPHIDHDHATGKVRGLLCRLCNLALGRFGDNVEGLQRALDYVAA